RIVDRLDQEDRVEPLEVDLAVDGGALEDPRALGAGHAPDLDLDVPLGHVDPLALDVLDRQDSIPECLLRHRSPRHAKLSARPSMSATPWNSTSSSRSAAASPFT